MTGSESFSFHVELGWQDFAAIQKSEKSWVDRALDFLSWLGFAFVGLILSSLVISFTGQQILAVLAMVTYVFAVLFGLRRYAQHQYMRIAEQANGYDLTIGPEGIVQKSGRTETRFSWEDLSSIHRLSSVLHLNMWDGAVVVLPNRFFENDESLHACLEFVERQLAVVKDNYYG